MMHRLLCLACLTLFAPGCVEPPEVAPVQDVQDMSPDQATAPDLTTASDLANPGDMASTKDTGEEMPPDLSQSVDMSEDADMSDIPVNTCTSKHKNDNDQEWFELHDTSGLGDMGGGAPTVIHPRVNEEFVIVFRDDMVNGDEHYTNLSFRAASIREDLAPAEEIITNYRGEQHVWAKSFTLTHEEVYTITFYNSSGEFGSCMLQPLPPG